MNATDLESASALVALPEGDLDVHDVLRLVEDELDLAHAPVGHDLSGARPPRLDLGIVAVVREVRRAAVAPFVPAPDDVVAAPTGAHVVRGGRDRDAGFGADLDGLIDAIGGRGRRRAVIGAFGRRRAVAGRGGRGLCRGRDLQQQEDAARWTESGRGAGK